MVNKIVTTVGKFIAKKSGKSLGNKISDTFDYVNERIGMGSKPLNIGENETLDCYKKYPNDVYRCNKIGDKIREEYHNPLRKDINKLNGSKK
jgi:hypothetical protein